MFIGRRRHRDGLKWFLFKNFGINRKNNALRKIWLIYAWIFEYSHGDNAKH